jgi:hypothetical protein
MKTLPIKTILFSLSMLFFSCAKNKDEPEPVTPINRGNFNWQSNQGTQVKADSAYYFSQFTTIFAFKNGTNSSVEINLSSLALGSYSISSVTGNALTFVNGSSTYTAPSGYCNITGTSDNLLVGTFSVNLNGGTITSLSGNFSDLPRK